MADCSLTNSVTCLPRVELAGVVCSVESDIGPGRTKRQAAIASAAISGIAQAAPSLVSTALDYFDKKEKEHQAYLNERPDAVDLSNAGVDITLQNDKGYMDLGGEFQMGNTHLKVQKIEKATPEPKSGGDAFVYPAGIGPMLMNGCFGTDYKIGDPCYAAKRNSEKCSGKVQSQEDKFVFQLY